MLHLDGSAVTVQTALAGQTALTVDPSFDYTDAGDENLTITGSGLGDIIALGSGNNTVIETTGSNIIFVKDAATAGSNTIHGGDGYDTIVGGQGNDTIVGGSGITTVYYSGARSEYQITRLDNGALQIADPGIGTPEGTDTLSGVEFFRFADKTYSFTAPVIATTDVAAVYGQTFAASDLFAAVDSDDPILSYQLLDSTPDPTSGKWLLGGAAQTASQIIDVSAAQLAQTEFQSGFGTDSLSVRAFDGIDWSEWTPLTVASPTSLLIGVNLAGAEFAPPYDTNTGQPHFEPRPGGFRHRLHLPDPCRDRLLRCQRHERPTAAVPVGAHPAHSARVARRSGARPDRRCRELCHRQGPQDRNRTAQLRFRFRRVDRQRADAQFVLCRFVGQARCPLQVQSRRDLRADERAA